MAIARAAAIFHVPRARKTPRAILNRGLPRHRSRRTRRHTRNGRCRLLITIEICGRQRQVESGNSRRSRARRPRRRRIALLAPR
jgi:hypothetical protein